jgi:hypothetical protein
MKFRVLAFFFLVGVFAAALSRPLYTLAQCVTQTEWLDQFATGFMVTIGWMLWLLWLVKEVHDDIGNSGAALLGLLAGCAAGVFATVLFLFSTICTACWIASKGEI